ncbi:hypothetical protein ACFQHW_09495 [Lapidilactobacillus achengensis]|uniref:Uncharacterized protein n=1 Tax=Lapidilactobacillus achengensis TaxID=2486000 RepID=A0ABW1US00_9LACO|nr:hypothetical protein [Lapidilactobacillus achengensis]
MWWSKQFPLFGVVRQCQRIPKVWDRFLNLRLIAGVVGFDGDATASGRLSWLTRWASFEANPQRARLVFKSSLVLSGKAAKDNFTTEPHVLRRLLDGIELICNRNWIFDEVLLQDRGQTIALFVVVRQHQLI